MSLVIHIAWLNTQIRCHCPGMLQVLMQKTIQGSIIHFLGGALVATRIFIRTEPCFVISIAARMVGVHAQTLRYYERVGLLTPSRTTGRQRLYSMSDIERLQRIKTLTEGMGVNMAGVEVALKLMNKINELENALRKLSEEVQKLRSSSYLPVQQPGAQE